ncbi:transcription initiation factor TFIID subunit 4b-like isoform X1 [Camellia sinensis]|uniref:transcription initiation factor TFIID subunit 4b-like isoform X1 n=2 Tax=Camellia sinensis TaxID=4442 RepID=UPI0010368E5F|nr:transcription initiation factor TFIID subunit 4b-like isoform X1 [Camellia sinensis]
MKLFEEDEDETMHSGADDSVALSQGSNHAFSQLFPQWQTSSQDENANFQNHQTEQAMNPMNCGKQVPFAMLLPVLQPQLDKDRAMQLHTLYNKLKKNEISKDGFVRHTRAIVGDLRLKMAVYKLQVQAARNSKTGPNQFSLQSQVSAQQHHLKMPPVGAQQGMAPQSFAQLHQKGVTSPTDPSHIPSSAAQLKTDSSNAATDNNGKKSQEMERHLDSHGMPASQMSSSSLSNINQERERSTIPIQGLSKQQQQNLHFSQSSFPIYGSTGGNYGHPFSGTNVNSSAASLKQQPHDSQMRQGPVHQSIDATQLGTSTQVMNVLNVPNFERQNPFSEPKRVHGGTLTHLTNNSTLQQNSVQWQSSTGKEQKNGALSSMTHVKQGPVDQGNEQQHKSQLSSPQGLSFSPLQVERGNAITGTLEDETLAAQPSRMSITAQLGQDPNISAKVVVVDGFQGEVGTTKRHLSLPSDEPSQRMKVQRSTILNDISIAPRAAGVSSEEENSADDLLLRRRLQGQSKANGFSDFESEDDDGDNLEANLNARDGDVARVTFEQAYVPIDKTRSQVVAPCVENRVTFATPLLQLGHLVAHSVEFASGGVPTISLFNGSSSLSSVDARPSLPLVGAQVSLPLVDMQPGTLPALFGVATILPLDESGSCVQDETNVPRIRCGGQASLPSVDGEFTVTRLDDGCISLAGPDGRERVLDPKVLFAGVRGEYLPRLNFVFDHRPSTFMRLEAVFLRRYLLEAFCDMLREFHGLTSETSIDTFQSFRAAVAEFQRHEFEVSWLRESLSRMEAQVKNRRLEVELAEMDQLLMGTALAREKAMMELERTTKVLADVDLVISSLRERRAVVEAQLVSVEGEVFDLDSQIGPS